MCLNIKIIEFGMILGVPIFLKTKHMLAKKQLPRAEAQIWSESQRQVEKVLRANENEVGHSIQCEFCPQVSGSSGQMVKW